MGWLPDGDDDDLSFETTPRGPPPGPLKPLPPRSTKRRAVVVDSDLTNFAGDFWGLAYLLSSKDCDVVYVMASGGDTRKAQTTFASSWGLKASGFSATTFSTAA